MYNYAGTTASPEGQAIHHVVEALEALGRLGDHSPAEEEAVGLLRTSVTKLVVVLGRSMRERRPELPTHVGIDDGRLPGMGEAGLSGPPPGWVGELLKGAGR